eukprot:5048029-Amphidinium_carterae.2
MSYVESTKGKTMIAEAGNDNEEITPHPVADADFAGCPFSGRSTSGNYLVFGVLGPMFLAAISKRQSCVSHSTPKAEIVAADTALRLIGLPALSILSELFE